MEAAGHTEGRPKDRIGRYVVTGRLGRGGMGVVYRGYDETLERAVAIKILTVEGTLDEESRRRFDVEAKAAARLQHPNILTVYELGQDRGIPFIAMELLSGADLESLVRSGVPLLLRETLEILIQVCRGLAFAHEHGVVHRDMKPSNVRILDDGTAKIMDFGIAKLLGTSLTRSGMMVGTVHYMSPEQIRAQALDGRSDVFSVGVMLYELLAGRRPFVGDDPTQVLYKIVAEEAPDLGVDLGPMGHRLRDLVARAMTKDASARLPSAEHFADELSGVLGALATTSEPLPPDGQERLAVARRLLKDGRAAESAESLRALAERYPESLETRRLLRTAKRETSRKDQSPETEAATFPELQATFMPARTERQAETRVEPMTAQGIAPTVLGRAPLAAHSGWLWALGAGVVAVIALGLGLVAMRGRSPESGPRAATAAAPPADTSAPPVATTPAVPKGGAAHVPEAKASLEPEAPPGSVAILSSYPLDVLWHGKLLAKGQVSPRVSIAAGRQAVTLVSATYALNTSLAVDVRSGSEASLSAPPLGRISIRATPDNCQVFIDGVFLDYPPIIDKQIAAGARTVVFKWADGTSREEKAEVTAEHLTYVTGRKD